MLLGLAATAAGCACLYLALPNQRWRAAPWPLWPACGAGTVMLVLGMLALAQDLQYAAAAFVFCTDAMLTLALLPYLGALRQARRASTE